MKTLSLFFAIWIIVPQLSAQQFGDTTPGAGIISAELDTVEIPQGVIYVRKPTIIPYVKVEYKYYLSHVNMVKVNVPANNGIEGAVETDNVPMFDSSVYSKRLERVYPKKDAELLSKMFVEHLTYLYSPSDTPRVDTMVIGMWINTRGKVQRVMDDPEYTLRMPDKMVAELTRASKKVSTWGEPGGYYGRKKMFKKAPLILESYYCEVFVIVSTFPLTQEQKITRYSAFDYPLNSPPTDEQQRASKERNDATRPR